jgi:hypothetical protein
MTRTNGLRIRQRASQATDLKGNWSEKPRFRALSVQCPENTACGHNARDGVT